VVQREGGGRNDFIPNHKDCGENRNRHECDRNHNHDRHECDRNHDRHECVDRGTSDAIKPC